MRGSGAGLCGKSAGNQRRADCAKRDRQGPDNRRMIRARQRAIGRELRRFYDGVAEEPVPDDFLDLLKQIDANTDKDGKGGD